MKIKILNDLYDGKRKIFSKDEIIGVVKQSENMIYAKEKYRQMYCFYKKDEGDVYEKVEV